MNNIQFSSSDTADTIDSAVRMEIFTIGAKQAFSLSTKKLVHPRRETKGKSVCVIAGKDLSDHAALLFITDPSADFLDNWNTSKYRRSTVVATEINNEDKIPWVFFPMENHFILKVDRLVLVSKIEPLENNLVVNETPSDRDKIFGLHEATLPNMLKSSYRRLIGRFYNASLQ